MPHVSKNKLDDEVMEKLFGQLSGVFKLAGRKDSLAHFTNELFTKTEKIMFAKRLAAILLLDRGMPQHVISDKLHMSPSTISKVSLDMEIGKYENILKIAGRNKEKIFGILLDALVENLPYPFGRSRNRYGSMYKSRSYSPRKRT